MTKRIHSHQLTVEQVEAQTAKASWQLAEAIAVATKFRAEEVAEAGESSMVASSLAQKPWTDETAAEIDVAMGMADEKMPVVVSEAVEEPTSGVNITMAES